MTFRDLTDYLPNDLLVKLDRASMAVSLETRLPLLDHQIVEFALRVPADQKIYRGQSKWLLRNLAYKHMPRELLDRPKKGFGIPVGQWLRGPLKEWADDLLSPTRLNNSGLLNTEFIRERWLEHASGRRSWESDIWIILMLQQWLEESK